MLRFPGLASPGKRHRPRSWKILEMSWLFKVVVLEISFLVQVSLTRKEIHCNILCANVNSWVDSDFRNTFTLLLNILWQASSHSVVCYLQCILENP